MNDFAGQPVVVYFYPADDTPGCTKEACQFNDNLRAFTRAGVAVLGISPDGADKHMKFRNKYGLKFPLLSDADHAVMENYGAYGEKTLYGKKTVGVIRSTFLIGADGKIARAWHHVRADGHAEKVLAEAERPDARPVDVGAASVLVARAPVAGPAADGRAHQLGPVAGAAAARGPLGHEIAHVGPAAAESSASVARRCWWRRRVSAGRQ